MHTLIAGSFYGFKIVLIPHNLPAATLSSHLQNAKADALIAEAGSIDLSLVTKANKQISNVVWVAKYGNRHMDWHEVPKDAKETLDVTVWHELAEEGKDLAGFDVPEYDPTTPCPTVNTVWPSESQSGEFIDFKQEVREIIAPRPTCILPWRTHVCGDMRPEPVLKLTSVFQRQVIQCCRILAIVAF